MPTTTVETRAEERARARRERLGVVGPHGLPIANPGLGMPGQLMPPGFVPAVAEAMPQRFVPTGWQVQNPVAGMPFGGAQVVHAAPQQGYRLPPQQVQQAQPAPGPYPPGPYGYGPPPQQVRPAPGPYAPSPYGYGPPPQHMVMMLPPRVTWSARQRRAALLSSWLGQTLMALATHLLTAGILIAGFALLLHTGGDGGDFETDSFTAIVARWTMPDRIWATALIGLLIGGGLLAGGWLVQAMWSASAGLTKPHRSTWLAWLCTTAATGLIGLMLWPIALIGAVFAMLASSSASFTVGTLWTALFWELGIAVVLTGLVGMLFGWLFLSQSRPRVDLRALAAEEEAAARARDEAELATGRAEAAQR